jgi:prepilin-type processing-associated H-X9-DG protein
LVTIEDDAEWNRFVEAAKHFPARLSWVGVLNENESGAVGGGEWVWKEEGNPQCSQEFFASGEYEDAAKGLKEGEYFGAMVPLRNPEKNTEGIYAKQNIYSMPSFDWNVTGMIVEYQKNLSSTYTLNGWALSDHPRMKAGVPGHFYRGMEEGGSEAPLFSEGTGPVVMPMESNRPSKNLEYGGQTGQGLSRLCIDRYHNGANNVAFMDGSVDSVKLAELWKLKWHKQWKAPRQLPRVGK